VPRCGSPDRSRPLDPRSTAEYLDVLRTYSDHRALSEERRAGLLADIGALIDGSYGGSITKRYLFQLRLARRL
jgi:hypothetical protein